MKPVLMIAYHYPPEGSSSGVLRTLKFSKHLPKHGWRPHVLTLRESLYDERDEALLRDVPPKALVHRTLGFDATRHLAVKGRHLSALAIPDRFATWLPFGVACGLRVIRQHRIQALYSTSPLPTTHLIAMTLQSLTHVPWIADFRDPWIEPGAYPAPGTLRCRVECALEALVMRRASRITVTTDRFRDDVLARYPRLQPERVVAIFNGYDEDDFRGLESLKRAETFELLHTGMVTPEYRNPLPLLRAVRRCIDHGDVAADRIRVGFLGGGPYLTGPDFNAAVAELKLESIVSVGSRIPYHAALRRMADAAALLLLQASDDTSMLIPAKAFEYLRVGRPVLALTGEGATADLVRRTGAGHVADWTSPEAIASAVAAMYREWATRDIVASGARHAVRRFERASLTSELADLLDSIVDAEPSAHAGVSRLPKETTL